MNNDNYWKKIKTIFKGLLTALDSLEFVVIAILGTLLFVAVPFYLIRNLFDKGHIFLAILLILIAIVSFGICARDFKKRKWSGISIIVIALWIICFVISGWMLMF